MSHTKMLGIKCGRSWNRPHGQDQMIKAFYCEFRHFTSFTRLGTAQLGMFKVWKVNNARSLHEEGVALSLCNPDPL